MENRITQLVDTIGCSRDDAKSHWKFNKQVYGEERAADTALYSGKEWETLQLLSDAKLQAILNPPRSVNKSSDKCRKCGENNVMYQEIQMRSIDEPATVFFQCSNYKCKATWRVDP